MGAVLLVGLLPAQALALPPDPAAVETGRETLASDPLALEPLDEDQPVSGETFDSGLEELKVRPPSDVQQAPPGTTTPPPASSGAVTFGSGFSQVSTATAATDDPDFTQVPNVPLRLGQAEGHALPTGTWQAAVVDRSSEISKGVEGALTVGALVTIEAPSTGSVPISVQLDYGKFENLYGADWASRLRLVQFPECYLTTPLEEACQEYEELETANDTSTHTLTATVDTAADGTTTPASTGNAATRSGPAVVQASYTTALPVAAGGDKAVVGAVDSGAGAGGSFKATPLASSGKWAAGGSSGAFTWGYPLVIPPAPAGPAPKVTLSYSSQSVDGRTAVSSPQASWIGEGWDYDPGHIERRYRSCKDDTKTLQAGSPNNTAKTDKTSDLCWVSYNAVMSLGGSTVELVRVDAAGSNPESDTEIYRPKRDDGTRIQRRTGGTNDDNNGEYWVVTTTDGTEYYFGLNQVGGGHANTDSVSTVPVFGNHPGEPCHASAFADSRCGTGKKQQAWRWGLDKVVDVHGNVMVVNWGQEENYYAVREKRKTPESYDRFGYPKTIEYGMRAADLTKPSATVEFGVKQRCLKSATDCDPARFAKTDDPGAYRPWWDTPGALNCKSTSKLCPGFPSFWTQLRLETITTKAARAGQSGLGKVDTYTLRQSFPEDWYDTSPGLWLNSITRTGFGPGDATGTIQSKDGVSFAQYTVGTTSPLRGRLKDQQLPNLVPTGASDKRPGFTRPRIGAVATEAGGSIEVEYTGGCTSEPATDQGKNNTTCYPVRWSPDGDEKTPAKAWFNKYVVDSVTEVDKVASPFSKPVHTKYGYQGPAWAKTDDEFTRPSLRTYSDWLGYRTVTVTKGSKTISSDGTPHAQSLTETRYFLGTGGEVKDSSGTNTLLNDDAPQYAGMMAEAITYLNSDKKKIVKRTLNYPESTQTASRTREAEDGTDLDPLLAHRTDVKQTDEIQTVGPGWQAVRTSTLSRDVYGLPTSVESAVVKPNGTGETLSEVSCTKTAYVHNTGAWLIGLPKSKRTTATDCASHATADPATELQDSVQLSYDGLAYGDAPTKGMVTGLHEINAAGTAHAISTTTTYDPLGRVRTVTKPDAGTTETQYTPGDVGGPVTSVKTLKTVNSKEHVTTTAFDPGRALPLTVTDPNGRVSRTEYDALGRLTKGWSAARSSGGQTPNVEIAYQAAIATPDENRPAAVTVKSLMDDGTYAQQVTLFDGLLRQIQTQSEAHGPGRIVVDTRYDDHGLVGELTSGYLAKGEPTADLFAVKTPTLIPSSVKALYDGLERPVRQTTYHGRVMKDAATTTYGDVSVTVDPVGSTNPTTTTYSDALGRVTSIRHQTGSEAEAYRETVYAYDKRGNRNRVTDPAGNNWTYAHDARGRVTSTTDPDTGTTSTEYDDADRPTIVRDSLNKYTYTAYDLLGRITAVREGSALTPPVKEFTYDGAGALGLPVASIRHTASGDYIDRVTGYDIEYRPTGRETVIPPNAMTTGLSGTYAYSYTYTLTGKPQSVTLPAKGGLTSEQVITRYDEDGLPESTSGINWYTTDVTYSPYGEALRTVSGAQPYRVWTTNFIDEHTGRLQRTVTDRESAGPHLVSDSAYAYDASGMITASARKLADASGTSWDNQCFAYDTLGELVRAWTSSITPDAKGTGCKSNAGTTWGYREDGATSSGPVADAPHQGRTQPANLAATAPAPGTVSTGTTAYHQSFTFDWIGNRATMTEHDPTGDTAKNTSYAYAYSTTQPHTLTSVVSTPTGKDSSYTYNATGTTKSRDLPGTTQDQDLAWTTEQKLESNTVGGVKTTYVYDAAGNRILENSPTGSTLYLGETELTTDSVGKITQASRAYAHPGAPTVVRTTTNGSTTGHKRNVLIADHLGTANTTVELSGTQSVTRRAFKPYGELRGPKPTAWPNKRSYLGVGIDDTASGLTHIGAREYDQTTGRFLSADPLIDFADPLQMNGYTYANGSPASLSDPTGLRPEGACGGSGSCNVGTEEQPKWETYTYEGGGGWSWGWGYTSTTKTNDGTKVTTGVSYNRKRGLSAVVTVARPPKAPAFTGYAMGTNPNYAGRAQDVGPGISADLAEIESWSCPDGDGFSCEARKEALKTGLITGCIGGTCGGTIRLSLGKGGLGRGGSGKGTTKAGDCNCFLAGTDVLMADGTTKDIEDVKLGDEVLATDPETGEEGPRKVSRLIRTSADKHFNTLSIATDDGVETLTATYEHPFWSPSEQTWLTASDLQPGMTLLTDEGHAVIVTANKPFTRQARTYNLTVDDIHTYYVLAGATPVLVHNSNCVPEVRTLPSRNSAFRAAKRDLGIPNGQQPDELNMVAMTNRNGENILNPDGTRVMTREYVFTRRGGDRVIIQDHSYGHYYGEGGVGDQGAHFNVRPYSNPRTGKVPGTAQHYEY
ncbi:HNH/endonuclease VII fold putative polymorphic toxin [Streptomyces sp. NPDC047981]|uniref:HNH/endonuclease VII fold putative polymorphic toxin n=1 Tax=Streptomyces sp. NPDC047981 TaxID=3154610 RepID=UPI0034421E10